MSTPKNKNISEKSCCIVNGCSLYVTPMAKQIRKPQPRLSRMNRIRLEPELENDVQDVANRHGFAKTEVIRQSIRRGLPIFDKQLAGK